MSLDIKEIDKQYIANTYTRFPVQLVKGAGCLVYDEEGKEYIDMGSGIAVNTFGYCDDVWRHAVEAQLGTLQHSSNLYYTEPCAQLAQLICKKTDMKKVFFANSGAEANECAIKAARKYAAEKYGSEYYTIITLKNSFHGRTITTLAATGQEVFHKDFLPLTEGFVYAKANDLEDVARLTKEYKCAAIMFECIQGEGGVLPLSKAFLHGIEKLAAEKDILLIADEVQTGNGRTGKLYAYMNYDIKPDIFTTAKGLGGGLPIGAAVMGEKVKNVFDAGSHGSTFGGNPVCCAGAISILERLDNSFLNSVKEKSSYIIKELQGADGVKSISGMGLMLGVETVKPASDVISICIKNGVLVLKAKDKVRLLPPLNIPMQSLKKAVAIIKYAVALDK
ncbi:MAG: aspartate aminotransferase family protein [Bacillota bacterium]|nr:aspartate aminotransferase family protein [Bacillota bacterium]